MKKLSLLAVLFLAVLAFSSSSSAKITFDKPQSGDSAVCLVSDEPIEEGKGIKLMYLGKEYAFCCEGCVGEFKAASIKYTDGKATCPICNHDDGNESITSSHEGITYYFCAKGCKEKFEKNPEKVLQEYNKQ
jgi:YHS domain-containing protein